MQKICYNYFIIFNFKSMNIAINGFGRIGRAAFKAILEKPDLKVAAINDLAGAKTIAHLLKYDSCYGRYKKQISYANDNIIVDGTRFMVLAEKEPAHLPWRDLNIDIVLECTGKFTKKEEAAKHLDAGAKMVIISAPAKSEDIKTIVLGVNEEKLTKNDKVISMASCTTNCLAPVAKIIRDSFGIKKAVMTTIHSYTADQNLVDGSHRDLRRARAAAINIVPTTTGAATATAKTVPELKNKFDGLSMRVPTAVVSLSDIIFLTKKKLTLEKVSQAFKQAASGKYKNIVEVTEEDLVSSDYIGNPASAIVDLNLTKIIDGDMLKVIAWYDNEWGYSSRLADLCGYIRDKSLL